TVDKQRGSSLEEAEPRVAPNRQSGRVGSPIPHVVVAARLRGRFETPLAGAGGRGLRVTLTDGVTIWPGSSEWSAAGPGDCDLCGAYTEDRALFAGRLRWGLCGVCMHRVMNKQQDTLELVHEMGRGSF